MGIIKGTAQNTLNSNKPPFTGGFISVSARLLQHHEPGADKPEEAVFRNSCV